MKDDYDSLEEAFAVLFDVVKDFDPKNLPPRPPGFQDMMLMINLVGTTVCARTHLAGQLVSLSIIVPSDKTQDDRYFVNTQEVPRTLPQLEIDLVGGEDEPGGVLGEGLEDLGLGNCLEVDNDD